MWLCQRAIIICKIFTTVKEKIEEFERESEEALEPIADSQVGNSATDDESDTGNGHTGESEAEFVDPSQFVG